MNNDIKNISIASDSEINDMMDYMDNNLKKFDNPKVGIFWYSPKIHDLFGVVAVDTEEQAQKEQRNVISCTELHKNVWKKKYHYYKYHGGSDLFVGDYKYIPRGRVFYYVNLNKYVIMVGSWIYEYPEAVDLVKIWFSLEDEDVEVKIGIHWEIGMGYGE